MTDEELATAYDPAFNRSLYEARGGEDYGPDAQAPTNYVSSETYDSEEPPTPVEASLPNEAAFDPYSRAGITNPASRTAAQMADEDSAYSSGGDFHFPTAKELAPSGGNRPAQRYNFGLNNPNATREENAREQNRYNQAQAIQRNPNLSADQKLLAMDEIEQMRNRPFTKADAIRLNQLQNGMAEIQRKLDNGEIGPDAARRLLAQVYTPIGELERRKQETEQKALAVKQDMEMKVNANKAATAVHNAQFTTKSTAERTFEQTLSDGSKLVTITGADGKERDHIIKAGTGKPLDRTKAIAEATKEAALALPLGHYYANKPEKLAKLKTEQGQNAYNEAAMEVELYHSGIQQHADWLQEQHGGNAPPAPLARPPAPGAPAQSAPQPSSVDLTSIPGYDEATVSAENIARLQGKPNLTDKEKDLLAYDQRLMKQFQDRVAKAQAGTPAQPGAPPQADQPAFIRQHQDTMSALAIKKEAARKDIPLYEAYSDIESIMRKYPNLSAIADPYDKREYERLKAFIRSRGK